MKKIFTVLGLISATAFMNAQIVINEIYGGGGNSGAPYTNDFIELKNIGNTSITLTNATIQYASATGTFNSYQTLPTFTLAPGQTYLIQEAGGATGSALPTPDFAPTNNTSFSNGTVYNNAFNLQANNGKVALANSVTQVVSPTDSHVLDFVGYGTGNLSEGAPAPAPSNTTSIARISGDTNNNSVDFVEGAPTPQNSTMGALAVSDVNLSRASNFVKNTFVKTSEITFGSDVKDVKIYNMFGQIVKSASVKAGASVNVADLAKGNYIVTGTVNNQPVSQKILKD
ncbi:MULTISPECIES: lamin tail domain-containing protein [unclassified Chryseobacterium]|uniref:lamin tail domain-containing protein n=1 Tax=unclassified Chryseobacterium TaxID=2593645 RepID=UPI00226A3E19|nr:MULTISPECIES: lamin tail domain-containing protein [unclassified Chryseobacterium]